MTPAEQNAPIQTNSPQNGVSLWLIICLQATDLDVTLNVNTSNMSQWTKVTP